MSILTPAERIAKAVNEAVEQEDAELYMRVMALAEKPLVDAVLTKAFRNQVRAAKMLGISRNTLRRMMTTHGIAT